MPTLPVWPSIEAGSLRHEIEIQAQSTTNDSFGQQQLQWTTVRTTKAAIRAISGREVFQAGQLTSQLTHTITVRWTPVSIKSGMRVVFGTRIFKIQVPDNLDERNVVVKLLCLELNAASS